MYLLIVGHRWTQVEEEEEEGQAAGFKGVREEEEVERGGEGIQETGWKGGQRGGRRRIEVGRKGKKKERKWGRFWNMLG